MKQEQIFQVQMMEQESQQLNQQLEIIDQHINELYALNEGLTEIEKKNTKQVLAHLGKKMFIPVEIKDKSLIVEVGNKKFVKKSIPETKEVITDQLTKLHEGKKGISEKLEALYSQITQLMQEVEKNMKKEEKK